MFVVDFGLRLENLCITSGYSGSPGFAEDIKSLIKDDGHTFETSDWAVQLKKTSVVNSRRPSINIRFMDGDKRRYTRYIPLDSDGTLLLGHDDISGKLGTHFLRDDATSELCSRFGVTTITDEDPNTQYTGDWSDVNYDGDWEMVEVIADGGVEASVSEDERLGYRGQIKFLVRDASWAIVCRRSYKDWQRSHSYELYTELSAQEMIPILEAYMNAHEMASLSEVFGAWGLE